MTKGMDYKMVRGDTTIQILQVKFSFSVTINITFCTAFVIGCFQFASYLRKPIAYFWLYMIQLCEVFFTTYICQVRKNDARF